MELYESNETSLWEAALTDYPDRLRGLGKERLVQLDEFYRIELPKCIEERGASAHITKEELVRVVDWKLTRGKWRPRLLGYAQAAADSVVEETSKKAFAAFPDVQQAVKILSELKGIGPATASAVLAAYKPDLAPFMSDEALSAALQGSKDYTPKKYAELADALSAKAKLLGEKSTGEPWTPSDVERAIWSEDAKGKQKSESKSSSKASSAKVEAKSKSIERASKERGKSSKSQDSVSDASASKRKYESKVGRSVKSKR